MFGKLVVNNFLHCVKLNMKPPRKSTHLLFFVPFFNNLIPGFFLNSKYQSGAECKTAGKSGFQLINEWFYNAQVLGRTLVENLTNRNPQCSLHVLFRCKSYI